MKGEKERKQPGFAPSVLAKVKKGQARETEKCFTDTFLIGRSRACDLQVTDAMVSRSHVRVLFDGHRWWIRDAGSANGTFMRGARVQEVLLPDEAEIELGKGGPLVLLEVEKEKPCEVEEEKNGEKATSVTQVIHHYFGPSKRGTFGEQTMMFRRAFERVHKKRSRKYLVAIGASLLLLLVAGSVILYQTNKLRKLKNTAVDIFYTMKSLELQVAQLEELVMLKADAKQVRELLAKRQKFKEMEKDYDQFVKELGLYKKKRQEEQVMLRVARLFGECEVKAPRGFLDEVWHYIKQWKTTNRLEQAIHRSKAKGFLDKVVRIMNEHQLPPQFFFVALQESDFDLRAIGPKTRFGYAKGIWQFIPITAKHYGLKIGTHYDQGMYDPRDERFHFEKATKAAARYIKDINNTLAQASGLLVIASYNWGSTRVREILNGMPEDPRERNFWRLLATQTIPQETYDYVFYIFSAVVICENPRLFGFDFEPPMEAREG